MPRISIGGTRELTVTTNISGQPVTVSGDVVKSEQYGAWGVQVSGAVIVSGDLTASVSGQIVKSEQYGTWGVQVSGAVQVSGEVSATQAGAWDVSVSGSVEVINTPNVVATSGVVDIRAGGVQVSGEVIAKISGEMVDIVIPTQIIINAGNNPLTVSSTSGGIALTSSDCISVTVKALSANSGDIYVGGYTAGNMPYSGAGLLLEPGEAVNIDIDNTGKVRVFAAISGDKVTYIANN